MLRVIITIVVALALSPVFASDIKVLVEEAAREKHGASLPETSEFDILLQGNAVTEAEFLPEFHMDLSTGQFIASAVMADGSLRRVSGFAVLTIPVPVPTRRIMPGEILSEADFTVVNLPRGRVSAFAVLSGEELVGMEVRRMLTQGRPISTQSVRLPLVIRRGDLVELRFSEGRLLLTAPGRSLADAHQGQEVKIVNLVSNKSVMGVARSDGQVEIVR